jgi:hypothetical protein
MAFPFNSIPYSFSEKTISKERYDYSGHLWQCLISGDHRGRDHWCVTLGERWGELALEVRSQCCTEQLHNAELGEQ